MVAIILNVLTYLGPRYLGGYSDHLPLVFRFERKDD